MSYKIKQVTVCEIIKNEVLFEMQQLQPPFCSSSLYRRQVGSYLQHCVTVEYLWTCQDYEPCQYQRYYSALQNYYSIAYGGSCWQEVKFMLHVGDKYTAITNGELLKRIVK